MNIMSRSSTAAISFLFGHCSPLPSQDLYSVIDGKKYGFNYNDPYSAKLGNLNDFPQLPDDFLKGLWKQSDVVPELLEEAPPDILDVSFLYGTEVRPNTTLTTGLMYGRPKLIWPADPNAFYTILLVDNGIERLQGAQFIHWMVVNVPGNEIEKGVEVIDYLPVFLFKLDRNGQLDDDPSYTHTNLLLVYRQQGPIISEETQKGCTPDLAPKRINDKTALSQKYNLKLVAGTFFHSVYSGISTDRLLCRLSKCNQEPFPAPLVGVNDGPQCKPREDILDITQRGPRLDKKKEFFNLFSLNNPASIGSTIVRETKGKLSTGFARDFQATEGIFKGKSLSETLEGIVTMGWSNYVNRQATEDVFSGRRFQESLPPPQDIFPILPEGGIIDITLSQPLDQDWNLDTIARPTDSVIELNIVKVKPGREEDFDELIAKAETLADNSKHVLAFNRFTVDPELNAPDGSGNPFQFDPRGKWQWTIEYKSDATRLKARQESGVQDVIQQLSETYDCITCEVIRTTYDTDAFGPF